MRTTVNGMTLYEQIDMLRALNDVLKNQRESIRVLTIKGNAFDMVQKILNMSSGRVGEGEAQDFVHQVGSRLADLEKQLAFNERANRSEADIAAKSKAGVIEADERAMVNERGLPPGTLNAKALNDTRMLRDLREAMNVGGFSPSEIGRVITAIGQLRGQQDATNRIAD